MLFLNASTEEGSRALEEAARQRDAHRHATLEGRLVLGARSSGALRGMHCRDPYDRSDHLRAAVPSAPPRPPSHPRHPRSRARRRRAAPVALTARNA